MVSGVPDLALESHQNWFSQHPPSTFVTCVTERSDFGAHKSLGQIYIFIVC